MSLPSTHEIANAQCPVDFERLVNELPGMVFRSAPTPGWPFIWVSTGCQLLTGYRPAELVEEGGTEAFTFHEDRAAVTSAIDRAIAEREVYLLEYRVVTKSGRIKWVWEKGQGVYDAKGILTGVEGFISDVTPLKVSEIALRESEARLHGIFDNTAEGIFQSSRDGTYQKINPALARIYGFGSVDEMMRELTDIGSQLYVEDSRRDQFVSLLERRDRVADFVSEVRRRDGSRIWISENARAVRDEKGHLLYYEGTVEDITERKQAQEDLATERNMLRTVIDAWPDIIYVKDAQGRYVLSNRAHTHNLGMNEPSEIVGRKPEDFFLPDKAARLSKEDLELMQTGRAVTNREELRIAGVSEQRWFLCAKLPLQDAQGKVTGLVSLSRDITHHKQTAEQLRHSQKMEAIGRLAGGVAHDFNNILTAILGYSELITRQVAADSPLHRDVQQIYAGATRAAALTQQLLTFSRKQVSIRAAVHLNAVVSDLEPMLRRLLGEHIRLQTSLDQSIGVIEADVHQIEQVLMNLVLNSRDAVGNGGLISISTSQVYLDGLSARQALNIVPGFYVRLAVADTGCGVPKEIQHRVFEPFFTTKDQGKGTGLGLATAYGIVEQSGGHITLDSEIGRGSTFTVFLPVTTEPATEQPLEGASSADQNSGETILLVEDDPHIRELAATVLGELGYRVATAEDGAVALEGIQRGVFTQPHLLITDVVMPRVGGKELGDRVREIWPETQILFMSGYNEEEVLHRGIATNSIAFLSKPFVLDVFCGKVRDTLAQQKASPTGMGSALGGGTAGFKN